MILGRNAMKCSQPLVDRDETMLFIEDGNAKHRCIENTCGLP